MKNNLIDMTGEQVIENDKYIENSEKTYETLKYVPFKKIDLIYRIKPTS